MRPREAAVMPLPSEEVTPPVTNTNLGTSWTSGVFLILRSGDGEGKAVQNDEAGSIACGVRWIGRNLDRRVAAAIVEVSIKSQRTVRARPWVSMTRPPTTTSARGVTWHLSQSAVRVPGT